MSLIRRWSTTLITAVITAGVLLGLGVLVVGGGSGATGPRTTGGTTPAPVPGKATARLGQSQEKRPRGNGTPEGVALVHAPALGPASAPAHGKSRGGVPCGSSEQLTYHVHARLTLFVDGKPRSVPLGVGIGKPFKISDNPGGKWASGGTCFSFLHTHAADGVIHIESPGPVAFTLRQFFAVWNQRLDARHLGRYSGRVVAYLNGKRFAGDPRSILLTKHTQIQLALGTPRPKPVGITWPANL